MLTINSDLAVVSCDEKCETSDGKWDAAQGPERYIVDGVTGVRVQVR